MDKYEKNLKSLKLIASEYMCKAEEIVGQESIRIIYHDKVIYRFHCVEIMYYNGSMHDLFIEAVVKKVISPRDLALDTFGYIPDGTPETWEEVKAYLQNNASGHFTDGWFSGDVSAPGIFSVDIQFTDSKEKEKEEDA